MNSQLMCISLFFLSYVPGVRVETPIFINSFTSSLKSSLLIKDKYALSKNWKKLVVSSDVFCSKKV